MALYGKDLWLLGPEDKAKHEKVFQSLNPAGGKLSGEQSKRYFMRSNLPTPVLGQIWSLADLDKDGRMTVQEFTIACHLIESKLKGTEIPKALPASLRSSTDPNYHGFAETNMQMPLLPIQTSYFMNGGPGTNVQAPPLNTMYGIPPNNSMGMSPMSQNMGMQNVRMNFNSAFTPQNSTLNRVASASGPHNYPVFSGPPSTQTASLGRHTNLPSDSLLTSAKPPTYNYSQTLPVNKSAFDSLALDKLTDLNSLKKPGTSTTITIGDISAPIRLKYTQMFKVADNEKTGLLTGEQARNILIQTGVNPQALIHIWEMSDINKDGSLDVEEFVIAMHLVDVVRSGSTLPTKLPIEVVPPHLKAAFLNTTPVNVVSVAGSGMASPGGAQQASLVRSGSMSEPLPLASFEDRRRMNWDKGQQELERRRKELLDRQRAEKEAQEQKEREIEEQKRLMREEAERKRLQEVENERLRREEELREQERLRKEMIEKQHAAQIEAERQRQQEWENRKREELMNQKDHEENIVNELKSRLVKLKGDLVSETSNRDVLTSSYEKKKVEGRELRIQIEQLNKSRELRVQEIQRLQGILQQSKADLSSIINEREKFSLELNQTDSTTTSEALGAIKISVQQMRMGVTLLRGKLSSIEAQTVQILEESNEINKQQKELNGILKEHLNEQAMLKAECEQKKREEYERLRVQEQERRKMEIQENKQENLRNTFEIEMKKRREREEEAMYKEKQIQGTSQRQRLEAGYSNVLPKPSSGGLSKPDLASKLQTSFLKRQDEMVQKQQDAMETSKVPPARPRTRPHCSPVKQQTPSPPPSTALSPPSTTLSPPSTTLSPLSVAPVAPPVTTTEDENRFETSFPDTSRFDNTNSTFPADFSAFKTLDTLPNVGSGVSPVISRPGTPSKTENNNHSSKSKKPPPRPKPPATKPYVNNVVNFENIEAFDTVFNENKVKDDVGKSEEEKRKALEKGRLEKEKEIIDQLKHEEAEKERKDREKLQKVKEEKMKKDADVKRRVEEMQRKKLEKKQALPAEPPSDGGVAEIPQMKLEVKYKMLFDFEPRNPDELSLTSGIVVMVDENSQAAPPGWLHGTSNGASGLFPANYAQKIKESSFSDYVDLDLASAESRSITSQESMSNNLPNNQTKESKSEAMPKLKPIPQRTTSRKQSGTSNNNNAPKIAMLPPKGPLKPLQPLTETSIEPPPSKLKQSKTTVADSDVVQFPSYDLVNPSPVVAVVTDDIYSVPPTGSLQHAASREDISEAMSDDHCMVEGMKVIALYPYRAQKEDHLSFDKNDYIIVQQQQDQWWFGDSNGKNGWFPKSYVKPVGTGMVKSLNIEPTEFRGSTEQLHSPVGSDTQNEECVALFDYTGPDGDLCFLSGDVISVMKKDGEWWQGTLHGNSGTFPANYVQLKPPEEEEVAAVIKKPEVAQVTKMYTAVRENEISLKAGHLIHVMKKEGDWWQGEVQVRGKNKPLGWFPSTHVKLMSKPSKGEDKKTTTITTASDYQNVTEDMFSAPAKRKDLDHVLALFSYTAQNDDELTFCKGSVINVISKDGDWWRGEVNGQTGVFPYNYVEPLRNNKPEQTSQWSGAFDSIVLKSMSPTERQRQNHIYELISTEQDYVEDLSLTLQVFYNPLAEAKVLSVAELNTVFINWKELIFCNVKFLKALQVRKTMSTTDKIEGIGDILIEQLPRFTPYIRFCSCMLKACRLLQDKVEKCAEFKQFEKKCAGDTRLKQNLPLSSYLLKPLQRITKYPLIITGILNYTPEDYYDRENLMIAHEKAEDLCTQINEAVRSQESSNRLEWLQERVNLEGLEEKLIFNSQTNCLGQRKYVFHGTLHKHKSNKELKAFIFNDFLLLCRVQSSHTKGIGSMFHPDNDTKFTIYKKPIFLNEVIVKLPTDPDVNETLFHVTHVDRLYSFRAESKILRNSWVSKIQNASNVFIETEREKRSKATRARSIGDNGYGRLVVTIIEGADLQASDPTGFSDPYCEISMGSQEHRTKVIPKDLNPKWNSTMVFNVKDVEKDVLCISVFDRDFFSPNDFLGRTEVSVSSIMEKGKGPQTRRLLLHEVSTGEIVVTLELQNLKIG